MNPILKKLLQTAQKPQRKIIGLMSGTSLDGLDIAVCNFSGSGNNTIFQVENFVTIPYKAEEKQRLKTLFAKQTVDLQQLTLTHAWLGSLHAKYILQTLKNWNIAIDSIDLIASHGQTIFHVPKRLHQLAQEPNATLQIGEADHIAFETKLPVISDFRQKHIAAGGEGAPLATYGDFCLFSSAQENRILLNIGGIANFTFLPQNQKTQEIFATDTGTGNTLIDQAMQLFFQKNYDEKGEVAQSGKVQFEWLAYLKSHAFFKADFPKTTGQEMFTWQWATAPKTLLPEKKEDIITTLTYFTAETISEAIRKTTPSKSTIYLSGGGVHNLFLQKLLQEQLPEYVFFPIEKLGVSADAKEALLFAILANEWLCGEGMALNGLPSLHLGKLSLP